jgi:hypothetical protein
VRSPGASAVLILILVITHVSGCSGVGSGASDVSSSDADSSHLPDALIADVVQDLPIPPPEIADAVIEDQGGETSDVAEDISLGDVDALDSSDADASPSADVSSYKGLIEWTVMVYLNGDNSLSEEAVEDLEEMAAAGWSPHVRVVVLLDTLFDDTQELVLGPDGFEFVDEPGELDLADWTVLRDFALRSIQTNPAKRYALILWNHGDGWDKPSPLGVKSLSSDDSGIVGNISVAEGELTAALGPVAEATGGSLDLLGFDMCLMGMWEVAVAVEETADVLIASEETEPADGWEYTGMISQLNSTPQMDGAALAAVIVEQYHEQDTDYSTLAALALDAIPAVSVAVGALGEALLAEPQDWDLVDKARTKTQWFDDDYSATTSPLRDLYHLTERLDVELPSRPVLQAATAAVRDAMDIAILVNASQSTHPDAHGLAIHFPRLGSSFKPTYLGDPAAWSGHPWVAFLAEFAAPICPTWTCKWSWYGDDDGCDCACGCWDPDCDEDPKVYHCEDDQICALPGLCQDAEGACTPSDVQCAGGLLLGTCVGGEWSLASCDDLAVCPDVDGANAFCWNSGIDAGPGVCLCADDPALCAEVQCGENDLGQWCGACRPGLLCYDETCFDQGSCTGEDILDCVGACGDSDWLGDDVCDDGEWDVDFDCELFGFDDGDCLDD